MQQQFTQPLLNWYEFHGRKNLPWQHPRSAYRVWVSEIMLQQTQVKTVIPYFNRFIESFPNIAVLAKADEDDVLAHWSGLGYYSRARNLHTTAKIITDDMGGNFPQQLSELIKLPGIGQSTAAAIASLAFNLPTPILDGNVKRVLCRYFLVDGEPSLAATQKILWQLAETCMEKNQCTEYTQAIMDLGATCCTRQNPLCCECPLNKTCTAYLENKVKLYPRKKPKKSKPLKEQYFLLFYDKAKHIFLEKRPDKGIWGGLWSLPVLDSHEPLKETIHQQFPFVISKQDKFLTLKHSFTHFDLTIHVITLQIENDRQRHDDFKTHWLTYNEARKLGLPKPVKDILHQFFNAI